MFANAVLYALTIILVENAVFMRGLGTERILTVIKRPGNLLILGLIVTASSTVSSLLAYFVTQLLSGQMIGSLFRPFCFAVIMGVLHIGIYYLLKACLPTVFHRMKRTLSYATFNCVIMGAMLMIRWLSLDLGTAVLYGLCTGLGFLTASFIIVEGQKKLALTRISDNFAGYPALLLYIGIISMAFFGLSGHLPAF